MAWTFVTVFNVRLASGRRRNPLIAMVAWPAAVAGIWAVADRVGDDDGRKRNSTNHPSLTHFLTLLYKSGSASVSKKLPS